MLILILMLRAYSTSFGGDLFGEINFDLIQNWALIVVPH